jgi:release factor glutamine methyltransferase
MSAPVRCSPWRVQEALHWAGAQLANTIDPAWAARSLLAHALGCTVTDLFVHPERPLTAEQQDAYRSLIARRSRHEPLAYLLGHRPFLDLDLIVDARVLIPRQETEILVEKAIALAQRWSRPRIADVGTGSGAIAVSLAVHLSHAHVLAIDASHDALQVARENARRHGVGDRIEFLHGDLLTPLCLQSRSSRREGQPPCRQVELIVANLPYVSEEEYAALSPDIRLYEPREALVSAADGLEAIFCLLDTAYPYLAVDGAILLEAGAGQSKAIREQAARIFPDARITVLPDYAQIERVVCIDRAERGL